MAGNLKGLRTIIYPVADLDGARTWWTEFLGFSPYFDEPFYVGFNVGGYELGLVPDANPPTGPTTYWAVDDVANAIVEAQSLGAEVHEGANEVGDGIVVGSVTIDSNVVGFIFNPHFVATQ